MKPVEWLFDKFYKKNGITQCDKIHTVSLPVLARLLQKPTRKNFMEFRKAGGSVTQLVFKGEWNKALLEENAEQNSVTQEPAALPGPKPMKDRWILLLCANITDNLKISPLLVGHCTPLRHSSNRRWTRPICLSHGGSTQKLESQGNCSWNGCTRCSGPPLRNILLTTNCLKDAWRQCPAHAQLCRWYGCWCDFIKVRFFSLNMMPFL